MLSRIAKLLLVSTSLAPVLGAVAVNEIAHHEPWTTWVPWLGAGVGSAFLCWLILLLVAQRGEKLALKVVEVQSGDKEILAFLLTYLLPFFAQDRLGFTGNWITGAYIMAVIFLAVAHVDAYHFNPVMGLLGYHFYAIKTADGAQHMLITRRLLRRPEHDLVVVQVTDSILLEKPG